MLGHGRRHLLPALGQINCLESALKPRIERRASLPTVHFLRIYDLQGRGGRFANCAVKIGLGNSLIDGWLQLARSDPAGSKIDQHARLTLASLGCRSNVLEVITHVQQAVR